MKKKPFRQYVKEKGRVPFIGITQDESFRRAHQYEKTGCNVYTGSMVKSQPLGPWTKQDIFRFVYEHLGKQIPVKGGTSYPFEICSVYKEVKRNLQGYYQLTGEQRTGCMYCCFGVNQEEEPNRFQRMMLTHPKCYAFCMKAVEKGGLGLKDVLRYMEIPYETWESVGQMCLNFDEDRIA